MVNAGPVLFLTDNQMIARVGCTKIKKNHPQAGMVFISLYR